MTTFRLPPAKPTVPQKPVVPSKPAVKLASPKAAAPPPPKPAAKGRSYTGVNLPPTEREMPPEKREVSIYDHTTDGRQELNRVCEEKGLFWGILSSSTTVPTPGSNQPAKLKLFVLVGSKYEFEVEEKHGYPQAVEEALFGLAAEIESGG